MSILQAFTEPLAAKNPPKDGDYESDGLLMCGKCGQPKRRRLTYHGSEIIVPIWCECMKRAADERERNSAAVAAAVRAAELRRMSMMSEQLEKCSFESADDGENAEALKKCRRYAERFSDMLRDNRGLLLMGGVGTGKTFAAACIANAVIKQGFSAVMTSLVGIVDGGSEELAARMDSIDLLVLDDLGAERSTDYGLEKVYAIADARYRCGKPVIYTTNLTLEELKQPPNIRAARIFDRVLERCYPIRFSGTSRRKREARRGFDEMTKLLEVQE